jgi:nickel-dependent lactate racemase
LKINRLAMEADLVGAGGCIEPHFFAGFSGGRKSVLPGIVSRETVFANHCAEFIASPYARTGNLENNPIHRDMLFAAETARLAFIVNVIINGEKRIVHAVAGEMHKAHEEGCHWLNAYCRLDVPLSDIVITSNGGYPLDQNLYQSPKAMATADVCCREGGVIIMCCACEDGIGGTHFEKIMTMGTPEETDRYLASIPPEETIPEQWCAQVCLRCQMRHRIILVSELPPDLIRRANMIPAASLAEALEQAYAIAGRGAELVVIPDGATTLVVPSL